MARYSQDPPKPFAVVQSMFPPFPSITGFISFMHHSLKVSSHRRYSQSVFILNHIGLARTRNQSDQSVLLPKECTTYIACCQWLRQQMNEHYRCHHYHFSPPPSSPARKNIHPKSSRSHRGVATPLIGRCWGHSRAPPSVIQLQTLE